LNPRPLGYEQADRRPNPSQPVAHTHAGLSRRHRAVSPSLTTSGSLRGVLVTITVTRAGWGQRCGLTPTVRFSGADTCPIGTDRASVTRCRWSLLVAVGRCCCCQRISERSWACWLGRPGLSSFQVAALLRGGGLGPKLPIDQPLTCSSRPRQRVPGKNASVPGHEHRDAARPAPAADSD
jgi:hypothetical protein